MKFWTAVVEERKRKEYFKDHLGTETGKNVDWLALRVSESWPRWPGGKVPYVERQGLSALSY